MKKHGLILLFITLLLPSAAFAQLKKLTIEDASYMNRDLMPESVRGLAWMGETPYFTYLEDNDMMVSKATSDKHDKLFGLGEINASLAKVEADTLRRMPSFTWIDDKTGYFTAGHKVYLYNISSKQLRELNSFPEEASNTDLQPNTFAVAYTMGNNLHVAFEGRQVQVTNDKDPGIVNGQTVHRNEFGISGGTFWSPRGNYLAFYRKDERMVTDYPLVDIDARIAELDNIKYPMAGMASHEVTLGIYDVSSGRVSFINTGEPADQYLTCVTWDPGEQYVYIAVLNRGQDHMKLNKYDIRSGALVKTLFEERNEKYVEPEDRLAFLNDGDHFIWISERDGYRHLYLYNTDGEFVRQLTSGDWVVRDLLGVDPKDKYAWFTATAESPLNADIFSVELKSGEIRSISEKPGTHSVTLNRNGKYYIDVFSDTLTPREYAVFTTGGKLLQKLRISGDPLEDYEIGRMSVFTIKAEDGTDLYCRMITPPGFDPSAKYPAIVYVYGGPHAQLVTNTWMGGASMFLYYLAQEGFVVFTLDNRGSANRGLDFEQAVHRKLGTLEVADQARGVEYLSDLPYIDPDRIGVHGWSYGGFMTISLMLKKPGLFKVGVCGGPVTDWKYYEVMYGERYMDTPESNPEGYEEASLLNHAGRLDGDLLIIHGTSDPVVVWQHSLALIKKFIQEGKQVDYFVYPGHGHGVGGRDRVHLNAKMAKYFVDHL